MIELANEIKRNVINMRKRLHQIPESGFNEKMTSSIIKEKLIELGYEIEQVAETGVIGYKKGDTGNGAIAFRADMDGLELTEETGLKFASKNKGMMHACGHDGHMAILLGFAEYISRIDRLKKDIVLIFQPAEEGPGGAEVIVKEGILKKYNVKAIFGLHILPDVEEGKIGARSGPIMAQTGEFDIIINAKSGHGAMPHTAIDGIFVASQLLSSYQSIVSRNLEPIEGAILTVGKIVGGERRNIIAENVSLEGTIRAFDVNIYNTIKKRMEEINKGIEKMFDVRIEMEMRDMYPAVVNDTKLYDLLKEILKEDELIEIKPMMISEDFSYYQQQIPGLFFMLGCRNEKLKHTHPLHSCMFNFNEDVLFHGVETYIRICMAMDVFVKDGAYE